ncbi:MAG: hypothetical protein ACLQVI_10765 [Polyangiaceae bacterium]
MRLSAILTISGLACLALVATFALWLWLTYTPGFSGLQLFLAAKGPSSVSNVEGLARVRVPWFFARDRGNLILTEGRIMRRTVPMDESDDEHCLGFHWSAGAYTSHSILGGSARIEPVTLDVFFFTSEKDASFHDAGFYGATDLVRDADHRIGVWPEREKVQFKVLGVYPRKGLRVELNAQANAISIRDAGRIVVEAIEHAEIDAAAMRTFFDRVRARKSKLQEGSRQ